jgi:hypothetical protein
VRVSLSSLYRWNRVFIEYPWPLRLFELVDVRQTLMEDDGF